MNTKDRNDGQESRNIAVVLANKILGVMAKTKSEWKTGTISIGRNIGKEPMGESSWLRFKADIMDLADNGENKIHFIGGGNGYYEGTKEESFTVVFGADVTDLAEIGRHLPAIAKKYSQEAIALTVGTTELFKAE